MEMQMTDRYDELRSKLDRDDIIEKDDEVRAMRRMRDHLEDDDCESCQ